MEQGKDSFFTKQFDNWEHFEKKLKNRCINYYQPVNIKRFSMKYNEKIMKFNHFLQNQREEAPEMLLN